MAYHQSCAGNETMYVMSQKHVCLTIMCLLVLCLLVVINNQHIRDYFTLFLWVPTEQVGIVIGKKVRAEQQRRAWRPYTSISGLSFHEIVKTTGRKDPIYSRSHQYSSHYGGK